MENIGVCLNLCMTILRKDSNEEISDDVPLLWYRL